ncbi:MAG: hypothetical protein GX234_03600 [Clostridiales bacterium]|nr:hypothetical protein [Clostridiales bacterium]
MKSDILKLSNRKLSIISFTEQGIRLSEKIEKLLSGEAEQADESTDRAGADRISIELFTKYTGKICMKNGKKDEAPKEIREVRQEKRSLSEWAGEQFLEKNALLFIGACGIAVRAVAPHLVDKLHDSPVLVMDEKGEYVIPVLSGHMGGANELAFFLAKITGAEPVITTATDLNRKFAVDLFAKKNGLFIVNRDGIARVSAKVLAGESIIISIENGHVQKKERLPEGIQLVSYPPKQSVDVVVCTKEREFDTQILLRPKEYVIGMGCRKGKEADEIAALINRTLKKLGICLHQVFALSSIEQKREEAGFLAWSRKADIPFITYTAEELQRVPGNFHSSAFVKEKVGVSNVCERAALMACGAGGRLVFEKQAEDGMTIAVARREWSVVLDEA